jgi:hypothetical protein
VHAACALEQISSHRVEERSLPLRNTCPSCVLVEPELSSRNTLTAIRSASCSASLHSAGGMPSSLSALRFGALRGWRVSELVLASTGGDGAASTLCRRLQFGMTLDGVNGVRQSGHRDSRPCNVRRVSRDEIHCSQKLWPHGGSKHASRIGSSKQTAQNVGDDSITWKTRCGAASER